MLDLTCHNISNIISFLLTTAIIYLLFWPVPIEPTAWESPKDSRIDPIFSLNQKLKDIKIFWINDEYVGPEDIVLKNNEIYGSSRRFFYSNSVKNDIILFLQSSDDIG